MDALQKPANSRASPENSPRYRRLSTGLLLSLVENPPRSLPRPTLPNREGEVVSHPPSGASGRVGNRAFSEISGEGMTGIV
ncbi:hypothetical protein Pla52n_69010 [Stieleria varia]|uniref:Uncharacterized protein n=1 Tax=Stieleria varia TaxID=2528005 RepID=A0A5C5ZPZ4_9BACT|nr:hypothetical protein Pla52n_69010 [Stieleria varia]